jgi:hypothetical protein
VALVVSVSRYLWALAQPNRPSWLCYPGGEKTLAPREMRSRMRPGTAKTMRSLESMRSLQQHGTTDCDEVTVLYSQSSDRAQWRTPSKALCSRALRMSAPASGGVLIAREEVQRWKAHETRLVLYKQAAGLGGLKILQWLAEHNLAQWREDTAAGGHRSGRTPPTTVTADVVAEAAAGGHLAVLEWLRANGYGHGSDGAIWATSAAALNGQLAALEWLTEKGYPFSFWARARCLQGVRENQNLKVCDREAVAEWIEQYEAEAEPDGQ